MIDTQNITDRGLQACHRVRELTDSAVLKFSGGKDSLACWLLLRDLFPKIIPIYHYWLPDLEFVETTLKLYEDYFQTPIIRAPHPNFLSYLADGCFQPPHRAKVIQAHALSGADYDEIVEWVCEDEGLEDYWVAVGIKASDSPVRRLAIERNGAWTPSKRLFYPVADMRKDDLVELIKRHNAPVSEDYEVFGRSFDGLQYRYLSKIKDRYPHDYAKIIHWFPLAQAEFMRKAAYEAQ